jgi:hypothetical protein
VKAAGKPNMEDKVTCSSETLKFQEPTHHYIQENGTVYYVNK